MELGTVSDVVVAIAAVAALVLSVYNYRFQKREARLRREEMLPSLKVSSDTRIESGLVPRIYSCRVVNDGQVPVEIRTVRMILEGGRTLPMPPTDEEMLSYLWENEKLIPTSPTILQPGQSIRIATSKDRMEYAIKNAGFSGSSFQDYEVAIVDALDNNYMVRESVLLGKQDPEP